MKKLILGMGITGTALGRYMHQHGIPFDCFDDGKDHDGISQALGTSEYDLFNDAEQVDVGRYDTLVVSPGPRPDHPMVVKAREAGLPIEAEVEFAFARQRGRVIGITGSNGKSTTTSLIHHILAGAGKKVSLCGNIGVPLIARVDDDEDHIYVLELSSFQLENVSNFRPDIGLLLNISPDHLDWHGGFEGYEAAKLRLFAQQQTEDLAVIPPEYADKIPGKGKRLCVPSEAIRDTSAELCVADDFRLPISSIPILGKHNRANTLFACAVAHHLGVPAATVSKVLPDFNGLEHRMEVVGTWQGRLWINDTKATNVHAAQAAVDALDQPYVLILGGCDKGERFKHLSLTDNPPLAIVAYGETAPKIIEDLQPRPIEHVHLFKDAVLRGHELAGEGAALLLAPACASFDQFENFAMRGKVFKQIFKECAST